MRTKYCSRGAHLGRSIFHNNSGLHIKDDLESICYILFDLFLGGKFLDDKEVSEYEQAKLDDEIDELTKGIPDVLR